jgi:sterol desaturase/sphingolipid hydroxylase (fatty acid hydroxylase superfamily)
MPWPGSTWRCCLPAEAWWVWVGAFVLYDFCYYWLHRMGHERNVLWAAHSVHHQSEEYNLTTALRQTSSGFIFSWIFYLPLALLGVPPVVFITVASLNLLYQFWVHTRHVPKLGWLEWVLITPSNHRVHHAQNLSTWIATTAVCSSSGTGCSARSRRRTTMSR